MATRVRVPGPAPWAMSVQATAIYICGGNVFRLAHALQTSGWLNEIRDRVFAGVPYAGTSAGAVVAGP
jgi:dipeptidase E